MRFRYTPLLLASMLLGMAIAGAGLRAATRISCPRPPNGVAPGTIRGHVIDVQSRKPLQHVAVSVRGTQCGAHTDADGRFRLENLKPGTYALVARHLGFVPVEQRVKVSAGKDTSVVFELLVSPARLEEVVTTATGTRDGAGTRIGIRGRSAISLTHSVPMEALATADELMIIEGDPGLVQGYASPPPLALKAAVGYVARRDTPQADTSAMAYADRLPPASQGTLRARSRDGKPLADFPLQHTTVTAEISGSIARTVVEQRYANPHTEVIEAVYVFPLPSLGAVNDFVMRVGSRKIVGLVRTREDAERIYQAARARGQTASLLTQERPNIFTQNVANIEPGGTVTISITYFERVPYEKGEYEWVFPMVVGPRYIPGAPTGTQVVQHVSGGTPEPARQPGGGWSPPTDQVPDADRITPPVLEPGQRSGHDISLSVILDAGLPISQLAAIAHKVDVERQSATRQVVRLSSADAIANRDFVLRWKVAGAETRFGVLAHRSAETGYFSLTMQPPAAPRDDQVMPREMTFILDISGSMSGLPTELSTALIARTLDRLRPDDHFNIVYFASGNAQLWERARPNTPENVAAAKRFLKTLSGGGGTEMLAGLRRALAAHHDAGRLQMYVFLTDGYVGNEAEIIRVVKEERGDARFFGFGIGSSVNRFLIDGIGEHGGGMSQIVIPRDTAHLTRAVGRLFDAIDSPVLVDIAIDWNGLPVRDVYPAKPRDLFAGQVIDIVGRYTGPASGTAYVTGRVGTTRVRYPVRVELPGSESRHAALAATWARLRIHELSGDMLGASAGDTERLRAEITKLALEHRLVSQFTAFVAVDSSRIVGDGRPIRIMQPVELPEGVSYEGIFGEQPVGVPVRLGAWGMTLRETESGTVRIAEIDAGGPAASAGLRRGAAVKRVDRVPVSSLAQLESHLLQSAAARVRLETEPGGERELPAP